MSTARRQAQALALAAAHDLDPLQVGRHVIDTVRALCDLIEALELREAVTGLNHETTRTDAQRLLRTIVSDETDDGLALPVGLAERACAIIT